MKTAVLFIHGFIGASRQWGSLAERLSGCGADMFFHILPGHEARLEDFKKTGARNWQDSVSERLIKLAGEYDRVVLAGHSMGGLLSVCAAAAHPDKVAGIVAIGFPLKIKPGKEWLKLMTAASKPGREGEDPRVTAARSMAGVPIKGVGGYLSTLPQNLQFLKTTRTARRALSELEPPLTVINFMRDEIVSPDVPFLVKRKLPSAEVYVLPASYHFLFAGREERFIADKIRRFIGG